MSDEDMPVVIQGCDRCNGNGTVRAWTIVERDAVPALPRKCPKCHGEGCVLKLEGGGYERIVRE